MRTLHPSGPRAGSAPRASSARTADTGCAWAARTKTGGAWAAWTADTRCTWASSTQASSARAARPQASSGATGTQASR